MQDVCVIVVTDSGNGRLGSALCGVLSRAGWLDLEAIVVDTDSGDATRYVEENFIDVRTLRCPGRGVSHASNRALELANARYVLFLDPEMELIDGDLSAAVATLDRRPEVALAGARKVWEGGSPAPGMKHLPPHWTSGFLLARRTALDSGGWFDERFLAFAEADLCLRLKRVGWEALYLPSLTVRTHKGQLRESAWLEAHAAYARMQFARKHFPQVAADYRWALALRYAISVCFYSLLPRYGSSRRQAARAALATVLRGRVPLSQ